MQFIIKFVNPPYHYTAIDTIAHTYSRQTHSTVDEALANMHAAPFTNDEFNDITDMDTILANLKKYTMYTFETFVPTEPVPYEFW